MELHRYAITFTRTGEARSWTGILDAHGHRAEFTILSQLNQRGVISELRIRDLGKVTDDVAALFEIIRELRTLA